MRRAIVVGVGCLLAGGAFGADLPREERYSLRVAYLEWRPELSALLQAGNFGSEVDVKTDLGIEDKRTYELRGALQPSPGFKIRGSVTPVEYAGDLRLSRAIVYNGSLYPISTRVESSLKGKLYSAALELDVIKNPSGFFGVMLGGQLFDGNAELAAPDLRLRESQDLSTPVPVVGATGRIYTGRLSFEGEAFGLTIGDRGHFYEAHLNVRLHLSDRLAVGGGYRLFKVQGRDNPDFARIRLSGVTFGAELSL